MIFFLYFLGQIHSGSEKVLNNFMASSKHCFESPICYFRPFYPKLEWFLTLVMAETCSQPYHCSNTPCIPPYIVHPWPQNPFCERKMTRVLCPPNKCLRRLTLSLVLPHVRKDRWFLSDARARRSDRSGMAAVCTYIVLWPLSKITHPHVIKAVETSPLSV